MSEFAYFFRGRDYEASPEKMQRATQRWVSWFKELSEQGHLKEPGHPLEPAGHVVSGAQRNVNDGPFAESKDVVGGYSIIEARDALQAAELAKGCPILDIGGSVEIRPLQAFSR